MQHNVVAENDRQIFLNVFPPFEDGFVPLSKFPCQESGKDIYLPCTYIHEDTCLVGKHVEEIVL